MAYWLGLFVLGLHFSLSPQWSPSAPTRCAPPVEEEIPMLRFRSPSGKTSDPQRSLIPFGACLSQTICNDGIYGGVKCQPDVRA